MIDGTTILLVEDDGKLLNANRLLMERGGYRVFTAECMSEAKKRMKEEPPDLIVLDIMLPDGSGLDFLAEIRRTSRAPVLLLTSMATNTDIMRGLEAGGDDYLPKPFDVGVLLVRVKALLRRASVVPETLKFGALKLDTASGVASLNDEDLLLSQKEFSLLLLFIQNEGKAMGADYLYEKVWKAPLNNNTGSLRFQISQLRKKLEGSGNRIVFSHGAGYCFERGE